MVCAFTVIMYNGDNMCDDIKGNDEDSKKNEKINAFVQEFHEHGMKCGTEISRLAKEIHPNAIAVVPLYRSCIVVEQDDEDKKNGTCTIHSYADPHWMGGDITIQNLKNDDFHSRFVVHGQREGPEICLVDANNYQKAINDIRQE